LSVYKIEYNDLKELQIFLYKKTGLYFEERKFDYLRIKLENRLDKLRIYSLKEYLNLLKTDLKEIQQLIDEITINETYFMREIDVIDTYFSKIIGYNHHNFSRIKIVSAACSSGEEPYSISILVMEKYPALVDKLNIFAFDIDSNVIEKAKKGIYRQFSLRAINRSTIDKYFIKNNGEYKINDKIKETVSFYNLSIFDPRAYEIMVGSDLILSRNVLIYFGIEYKRKAVNLFYESLKDNGYLILGRSESIYNVNSKFVMVHYPNVILYKKEVKNGS